jgi:hypothetical protein
MIWDGTTSIHNNWGNAPTQAASLLLTLQIALRADSIRLYPLDPSGRETRGFVTYLPSSPNLFAVAIDQSQQQSMWFGIEKFGSGVSTGASERASEIPKKFDLGQNYPNPFNPTTAISYRIPSHSFVTLKVYDPLGREVATLVNAELDPGAYERTFDATALPSGAYFYQLKARPVSSENRKEMTATKKLVLLR